MRGLAADALRFVPISEPETSRTTESPLLSRKEYIYRIASGAVSSGVSAEENREAAAIREAWASELEAFKSCTETVWIRTGRNVKRRGAASA